MENFNGLAILENNKNYVITVKPRGYLSQSTSEATGNTPDMVTALAECLHSEIFPVHRLDRETAGVMVYAKNKRAAAAFSLLVSQNALEKRYLAVVTGTPEPPSGEMRDLLYHDARKNKSYVVSRKRAGVKEAILDYETQGTVIYAGDGTGTSVSLVRIRLRTGRTHQIRVQFASRRMPLLGDTRYGCPVKAPELCLFAKSIAFHDPFSGEKRCFSAEPEGILGKLCGQISKESQ